MRYVVHNRQTIRTIAPPERHVLVSISGRDDERPKLPDNVTCDGILRMAFHDKDARDTRHDPKVITLFTSAMANELLDFWLVHRAVDSLYVHCDAGRSRSAAVAAALQRLEIGDDEVWFKTKTPNMLVYRLILNEGYRRCLHEA